MSKVIGQGIPWWRIATAFASLASPMVWWLIVSRPQWIHWPAILANTMLFAASLPVFIVLHEAAHAVIAKILRLQVPRIAIGFGPHVARFHIGATVVTVGMFPLGGLTYMVAHSMRLRRLRGWIATAAGPAMNALICIALLPGLERTSTGWPSLQLGQQFSFLAVIFANNAYLVVLNLLPFKTKTCSTDGHALLTLPFRKASFFKDEQAISYSLRAYEALEEKRYADAIHIYEEGLEEYPGHWILLHDRAVTYSLIGNQRRAREEYEVLLKHPDVPTATRAFIGSNIAWGILLSEDMCEQLARADKLSELAVREYPHMAAINGTRGAVLAARGDHKDAIKVLKKAIELNETDCNRAHNAAWLALAYANVVGAREVAKYLALSRSLDAKCLSLPVVEALIANLNPENSLAG